MSDFSPTGNSAIDGLAARIAQRDTAPELLNPHRFEPAWVRARLEAALAALLPARTRRAVATRAAICHAYVEQQVLTGSELAALTGMERMAIGRALADLRQLGLLQSAYEGGQSRRHRLTRFGEDWLLALARCETPPAAPG